MNEIAKTTTKAPLRATGALSPIVPQTIEEAFRLAAAVVAARMAPKGFDTPEKAMVAIMHGLEVGLTPMAALQSIAVVNGFPTIWGDGALGLVRGSGQLAGFREWTTGEGDERVAHCEVTRRGEGALCRSFSVADARRAGLWSKQGPWQNYPDRMLQMRARSFALRDGFADVLRGLRIREEVDDYEPIRDVTPKVDLVAKLNGTEAPGFSRDFVEEEISQMSSDQPPDDDGADAPHEAPSAEAGDDGVSPPAQQSSPADDDDERRSTPVMVRLERALSDLPKDATVEDVLAVAASFSAELNAMKGDVGDACRAKSRQMVKDRRAAVVAPVNGG